LIAFRGPRHTALPRSNFTSPAAWSARRGGCQTWGARCPGQDADKLSSSAPSWAASELCNTPLHADPGLGVFSSSELSSLSSTGGPANFLRLGIQHLDKVIGLHFWSLEEPRGSENRETVKGRDGETSSDSDGWRSVPDPRRVPDNQSLARHVRRRARDAKTQETPAIKVPGSEGALLGGLVCRVMSSSLASRQVPKQLHPPAESGLAARAGEDGCQNMAKIACCFSVSLGLSSAQCHAPHAAGSWSKRSQCRAELNDIADLTGPPCPSVFRVPRCGLVTATVLKAGTEHASSVDWPLQR